MYLTRLCVYYTKFFLIFKSPGSGGEWSDECKGCNLCGDPKFYTTEILLYPVDLSFHIISAIIGVVDPCLGISLFYVQN